VVVLLLDVLLALGLPLDGEGVAGDGDVDLLRLHTGKGSLHHQTVLGLIDVQGEAKLGALPGQKVRATEEIVEDPVHALAEASHIPEGIPPYQACHRYTSFA
jgi:hypothetical protein